MSKFAALMQQLTAKLAPVLPKGFARLDADLIVKQAEAITGLSDWGEPGWREGLERLIACYKQEAPHDFRRRVDFRNFLLYPATMRLRVVDTLRKNPEINDVKLHRPLIIAGYPRTGTTVLQNLLCLDPNAKFLSFWEAMSPVPPPTPETYTTDPRIGMAAQQLSAFYEQYPIWKRIHKLDADGPQECEQLFLWDFASPLYYARYPVLGYMNWLMERDMAPSYRFYRQQLQMLMWKFPGRHPMLKAPMHLPFIRGLVEVFPDASIVVTHRDPERVLGSICSLISNTREMNNIPAGCDHKKMARDFFAGMPAIMENYMALRKEQPNARILDLDYRDTVKDPVGQVKRIYTHFDYPWPDNFEDTILKYLAEHKQHKYGKHTYSVEEFGLQKADVHRAFETYLKAYPHYYEDLIAALAPA